MAAYRPDGDPGFGYRGGGGWLHRTATLGSGAVGVGDGSGYLLPREGVGAAAGGGDAEGEVGGVGGDEISSLKRLDEDGLTRGEHAREPDVAPRGEVPAEAAQVLRLDVEPCLRDHGARELRHGRPQTGHAEEASKQVRGCAHEGEVGDDPTR